jgi:hypothetical protein
MYTDEQIQTHLWSTHGYKSGDLSCVANSLHGEYDIDPSTAWHMPKQSEEDLGLEFLNMYGMYGNLEIEEPCDYGVQASKQTNMYMDEQIQTHLWASQGYKNGDLSFVAAALHGSGGGEYEMGMSTSWPMSEGDFGLNGDEFLNMYEMSYENMGAEAPGCGFGASKQTSMYTDDQIQTNLWTIQGYKGADLSLVAASLQGPVDPEYENDMSASWHMAKQTEPKVLLTSSWEPAKIDCIEGCSTSSGESEDSSNCAHDEPVWISMSPQESEHLSIVQDVVTSILDDSDSDA